MLGEFAAGLTPLWSESCSRRWTATEPAKIQKPDTSAPLASDIECQDGHRGMKKRLQPTVTERNPGAVTIVVGSRLNPLAIKINDRLGPHPSLRLMD
jgi:hypothetical protein